VQGRAALGDGAGRRDKRIGQGRRREPFVKAPLCAGAGGGDPFARGAAGRGGRGARLPARGWGGPRAAIKAAVAAGR
jgi:hypothetical protein